MFLNHGEHGEHGDDALLSRNTDGDDRQNRIADKIFDSAIKIHRQYGPGLLESAYEALLAYELSHHQKLTIECQKILPIMHEGLRIEAGYRIDLLVSDDIIVELKACEKILPIHEAQLLTYLRLSGKRLGIILNFNSRLMKDGMKRMRL